MMRVEFKTFLPCRTGASMASTMKNYCLKEKQVQELSSQTYQALFGKTILKIYKDSFIHWLTMTVMA